MGYDDRREILERLEALERSVHHGGRDDRDHDRRGGRGRHRHDHDGHGHRDGDRGGGRRDSDEKRIIDTIVRLVSERVGRMLESQQSGSHRNEGDSDEKRIVDLVVGLVAEKVQEIVSTELDRRLGPSETRSIPPPADEPESEET